MVINGLAQNLVPNFSFEEYSNCPSTEDQVQFCDGWSKYSSSTSTPDYYNSCVSNNAWGGVPQNTGFYQLDHRNCGAYMGLVTWVYNISNYSESIGIQLSQPLVIGQKYFLSFYVVMALMDDYTTPSNKLGMRLSTVSHTVSNPVPIDNFAHLTANTIITDTVNWVRISGSIIADSAYQYLMLGNFYDDTNTDTLTQTCGTCQNWYSYYLIDDVCISTDSTLCNGGIDALPCAVSIEENNIKNQFSFYPNPFAENTVITYSIPEDVMEAKLMFYNMNGRIIKEMVIEERGESKLTIYGENLESGIYTYSLIADGKLIATKKMVKQ